jgi:DinB superfamily
MDKKLTEDIKRATESFNDLVSGLTPDAFEASHLGKWTAGQDLKHLVRSMQLTNFVYTLPLVSLRVLFGKPNRRSRSEHDLREKYRKAIGKGVKAPGILKPGKVSHSQCQALVKKHRTATDRLCHKLEQLGDDVLEKYLVKHPAIGKATLQEMALLTKFHIEHHTRLLKAKLSGTAAEEL